MFIIFFLIINLALFSFSHAEELEIKGQMKCVIKNNSVISIKDGLASRHLQNSFHTKGTFGSNEKTFIEGDILFLEYRYNSLLDGTMFIEIHNELSGFYLTSAYLQKKNFKEYSEYHNVFVYSSFMDEASFGSEWIRIVNPENYFFYLRRYFKNDWEGIYTSVSYDKFYTHVVTLDCRNNIDRLDQILNYLKNDLVP